eukprot:4051096-Amphidinium_carterae.1
MASFVVSSVSLNMLSRAPRPGIMMGGCDSLASGSDALYSIRMDPAVTRLKGREQKRGGCHAKPT